MLTFAGDDLQQLPEFLDPKEEEPHIVPFSSHWCVAR